MDQNWEDLLLIDIDKTIINAINYQFHFDSVNLQTQNYPIISVLKRYQVSTNTVHQYHKLYFEVFSLKWNKIAPLLKPMKVIHSLLKMTLFHISFSVKFVANSWLNHPDSTLVVTLSANLALSNITIIPRKAINQDNTNALYLFLSVENITLLFNLICLLPH